MPEFSLPDTNKQERKLSEFTQKGKTVLLFFPFAFSGVCDKEMCVFRDGAAKFNSLNAQTVGISVDSVFTLKVFAQTYNLQFPLLSDFNKKVSRAYGVLHETWVALRVQGRLEARGLCPRRQGHPQVQVGHRLALERAALRRDLVGSGQALKQKHWTLGLFL